MEIIIKKPSLENIKQIIEINKDCWLEIYPNSKYKVYKKDIEKKFGNLENMFKKYQDNFKNFKNNTFVAFNQDIVCGYISFKKQDWKNYLWAMYIDKNYRNLWIWSKLIKKLIKYFKNENIYLTVAIYNENAINFYKKHWFEIIPNSENTHKIIPWKYIPIIEMERE